MISSAFLITLQTQTVSGTLGRKKWWEDGAKPLWIWETKKKKEKRKKKKKEPVVLLKKMLLIIVILQISTLSHFCGYLNPADATQTQSDALQCVYKSADWQNRKELFSAVCTLTKGEIGIPQLYDQIELRSLSQFQVAVVLRCGATLRPQCVFPFIPRWA